jgi:alkylation response protein AidB-like acyl-CoA dehydrogenase
MIVHEFARDVIRPAAPEYDHNEETLWPIMKQAHALGLDTYPYPEEFGGGGVSDMVTQVIVTEELSWGRQEGTDEIQRLVIARELMRRAL